MKNLHRHLMLATALATSLAVAIPLTAGPVRAEDSATVPTNPGFKPGTGQINPGAEHPAPSTSSDIRKIPTPDEARAALMAPDDPNPVLGPEPPQQQNSPAADNKTVSPQGGGGGDPTTATSGQAAIGGPLSPGASASGGSSGGDGNVAGQSGGAGNQQGSTSETTGSRAGGASLDRPGPIGATGQTMPATLSHRNDVLDRTPIMLGR